jgi:hypothetical protein
LLSTCFPEGLHVSFPFSGNRNFSYCFSFPEFFSSFAEALEDPNRGIRIRSFSGFIQKLKLITSGFSVNTSSADMYRYFCYLLIRTLSGLTLHETIGLCSSCEMQGLFVS